MKISEVVGGIGDMKSNGGTQFYQQDRVYDVADIAQCIPAQIPGGGYRILEVKKTEFLGSLFGHGPGFAGAIFDKEYVAPTLTTMQGGGREPHIMDVVAIDEQNELLRQETVGTLTTDGSSPKHNNRVCEIQCFDFPQKVRVRKYPVDLKKLSSVLRHHKNGMSNKDIALYLNVPVTNVEHWFRTDQYQSIPDAEIWFALKNLLHINTDEFDEAIITFEEKECEYDMADRVYGSEGLMPTLRASSGNDKILEARCVAERTRSDGAWVKGEQHEGKYEMREDEITNTITSVQKDNEVLYIKQATKDGVVPCKIGGVADLNYVSSKTRRGRVIQDGDVCPTITTENLPSVLEPWIWEIDGTKYLIRIRKLTPKECWSLMDFNKGSFEKAESVVSSTQLYKQAGNSIVVNCLTAIIGQMIEGCEDVYKDI